MAPTIARPAFVRNDKEPSDPAISRARAPLRHPGAAHGEGDLLAPAGRALGIDAGWSASRRSTGLCWLAWERDSVTWQCRDVGSAPADREAALRELAAVAPGRLAAAAIDGPLRPRAEVARGYRAAEALLARGLFARRGKPGATSAPSGFRLHQEATSLAALARATLALPAGAPLVEAFPNLFLGVLHDEADYPPCTGRHWTDRLFPRLSERLTSLVRALLPGRRVAGRWHLAGHEERAALACALTALCAAARRGVTVGSPEDGFIVLPPVAHWGAAAGGGVEPWALRELRRNLPGVQRDFPTAALGL